MNKTIKIFLFFFLILIILGIFCFISSFIISRSSLNANSSVIFTIEKGDTLNTIGKKLVADKIIKSDLYFKLLAHLNNSSTKIKAGSYEIKPEQSIKSILETFAKGSIVNREREITIIPGWTLRDVNDYFVETKVVQDDNFAEIASSKLGNWSFDFNKPSFLNDAPVSASLEGYLFPDTYRIFNDATVKEIIHKLLDNFDSQLTPKMREDAAKKGKSIYEIITMASIIEKEVKTYDDMELVSGIFWNRIRDGIALGSDATLSYILDDDKSQHSYDDLEINSPYNTYKYKGLPPGPICNPSLNAIKAAIYPKNSDYYYFLNRLDTGETIFSRTYNEHLKNKDKHLR